jgi:hypothetical protein
MDARDRVKALAALDPMPKSAWRAYHDAWRAVVAVYPETVSVIVDGGAPKAAALAAAGSLTLIGADIQLALLYAYRDSTDLEYLTSALAANPTAAEETLEVLARGGEHLATARLRHPRPTLSEAPTEVTDREVLSRLVERAAPEGFDTIRNRPWFAVVLSHNPHLAEPERTRLVAALETYAQVWDAPDAGELAAAFSTAAARLGRPGLTLTAGYRWVGVEPAPTATPPLPDPTRVRSVVLGCGGWDAQRAAATLAPLLGEDPEVWRAALALATDHIGHLDELAALAAALSH